MVSVLCGRERCVLRGDGVVGTRRRGERKRVLPGIVRASSSVDGVVAGGVGSVCDER